MNKRQKAAVTIVPIIGIIILLVTNMICNRTPEPGKFLYERQCANCHFKDGQGLAEVIPPLAGADYLQENQNLLPCIIRDGLNAQIFVKGKPYSQGMPANPDLNSGQIMNIINYINNSWGNDYGKVTLREVEELLGNCK